MNINTLLKALFMLRSLTRTVAWFAVLLIPMALSSCGGGGGGGGNGNVARSWQGAVLIENTNVITGSNLLAIAGSAQIAFDPSGNAIAVWQQRNLFPGTTLVRFGTFANRYSTTGGWGTPRLLNDTPENNYQPQVALDANGNAWAVWEAGDRSGSPSKKFIKARFYNVGVDNWGSGNSVLNTGLNGGVLGPEIAFDANRNAIAVWQRFDGTVWNVEANFSPVGGFFSFRNVDSVEGKGGNAQAPQIGFDDLNNNAIAVWQQKVGAEQHIWANRYINGAGWDTATATAIENNTGIATVPQIAVDGIGNATVVWQQIGAVGRDIWANHYDVGTDMWGTPVLLETDDTAGANNPQIAGDAAGNAMVVWRQSDGTSDNIYANRYQAGSGWGGATLIENSAGNAVKPAVAMDVNGNAAAVWIQDDGSFDSVYDNRYTSGIGWGSAALIENNGSNANAPQVAFDINGNAFAIWDQGNDIWTNRFQP